MPRNWEKYYYYHCDKCGLYVWYDKAILNHDYPEGVPTVVSCHKCKDGMQHLEEKESRGGKREGAGRKPLPKEDRLVSMTIRVTRKQKEWLQESGNAGAKVRELIGKVYN